MKKIISIFLCLILILSCNKSVNAQSTNNEFYETTVDNDVVFTSADPNLPIEGSYYFGLTSDGHVWYVQMSKAIPMIMNKVIGVTIKPEVLVDFISDYLEFGLINSPYKPVYNGSTKIGVAFEDLTGKTLLGSNNTSDVDVTIPSNESNNIYNYYNTWYTGEGYNNPDYVNLETRNKAFYENKGNTAASTYNAYINFLTSDDYTLCGMSYVSSTLTYQVSLANQGYFNNIPVDKMVLYATNETQFNNFVNGYVLNSNNNQVNFTSMMLTSTYMEILVKNTDNLSTNNWCKRATFNTDGTYTYADSSLSMRIGGVNGLPNCSLPYITVFKNQNILNQVINNTYAPVNFNTQEYYNYSTSNDNSTTSTTSEINNSTTTNETIYNESAESFSEYYSENNYHIDNSVTISNTTEIVNNFYGDDNGGDDNGGGSGGNDDDDSDLLDKLLDAIIDFFKNIGKIIGALLAGLFELLDSILDAIANINNSFEGIKNFLSSIFSWFPSEIVTLMVLGLGLALLASFITWFKK